MQISLLNCTYCIKAMIVCQEGVRELGAWHWLVVYWAVTLQPAQMPAN